MKIGIDTFCCDHGRSGIGMYLYYLVSSLAPGNNIEYALFGSSIDRYTYSAENAVDFCEVHLPDSLKAERFWHRFLSHKFYKAQKFDVVLYPAAPKILPSHFSIPGVAIINDTLSRKIATSQKSMGGILKSLSKIQKIIVPTRFLRNDLISLGLNGKKIFVVRHGIDHSSFYKQEIESGDTIDIKPFAIKRPYIIYPSRISGEGKKHIELIQAFDIFKDKTKLPHRLVLSGYEGAYAETVRKAAFSSAYASDIFITGFFPREGLAKLFSGAAACVFPSVQEGAGLPIIEAMASGIPVACSSAGALPETSGGYALTFDSDSIEEIAAAMERLCLDEEYRSTLIASGLKWSEKFTWKKCAGETEEILKSI